MMEYDLKLSQAHVQTVLQALGELPLKISLAAFAAVQEQVSKQDTQNALELKESAK